MDTGTKIVKDVIETPAKTLETTLEQAEIVKKEISKQKTVKKAKKFWHTLGPGLITGAADNDPSGIATYSQIGTNYGYTYLWLSTLSFPLMSIVQEMCARIGIVTGRGLAGNIKRLYSKKVMLIVSILLFISNTFNLGANLGAMAKSS